MNERRLVTLVALVGALVAANIATTIYFGMSTRASSNTPNSGSVALSDVSEKEAAGLVREIVDLYNAGKSQELYLKFDNLVRVQISEQKMSDEMAKLHSIAGKVEDYAYLKSEAGRDGDVPVTAMMYRARLSGGAFSMGTIKVMVIKKDGQLALVGFFINAQSASSGQ